MLAANLLCKSLGSWGHGFGWMIVTLHCAWPLWVVSWRSTCFSDHIWISCPGGSYDVASEEPNKGADGWPGFPEVFLGDCWRSMVALSVGWACFCLAWRCNPWRSQEFMKSCILVFSHIMPFEYRKHEYFRCPCKPTQNRNSVKLEFFHPSGTRRVLVRLGLHGLWGHSREVFWTDVRSPHPKTHMLRLPTNGFMHPTVLLEGELFLNLFSISTASL